MCGRYATTRSSVDLAALFEALDETGGALVPDYNVAPTDPVPVVLTGTGGRAVRVARWGLVPADGWYEWRAGETGKQAYFLTAPDSVPLVFAGLWSVSATGLLTCAIVTTGAVGDLASVHDRMPLLLPAQRWAEWLCGLADPARLLAVPSMKFLDSLEIRPVGPAVGDVRNDGPGLTAPMVVTAGSQTDVHPTDLTLF